MTAAYVVASPRRRITWKGTKVNVSRNVFIRTSRKAVTYWSGNCGNRCAAMAGELTMPAAASTPDTHSRNRQIVLVSWARACSSARSK